MGKRKPISKKLRMDIFKRDNFTCQYCGRMPPDVILEIDHIIPVVKGGDNSITNLVTSCRDCNRGKGKTELSLNESVKIKQKQLKELAEKVEQSRAVVEWEKELLRKQEEEVSIISDLIYALTGRYELSDHGKVTIRKCLKQFSFKEVYGATEISFNRYYEDHWSDEHRLRTFNNALSKIGGICYNKRKEGENHGGV